MHKQKESEAESVSRMMDLISLGFGLACLLSAFLFYRYNPAPQVPAMVVLFTTLAMIFLLIGLFVLYGFVMARREKLIFGNTGFCYRRKQGLKWHAAQEIAYAGIEAVSIRLERYKGPYLELRYRESGVQKTLDIKAEEGNASLQEIEKIAGNFATKTGMQIHRQVDSGLSFKSDSIASGLSIVSLILGNLLGYYLLLGLNPLKTPLTGVHYLGGLFLLGFNLFVVLIFYHVIWFREELSFRDGEIGYRFKRRQEDWQAEKIMAYADITGLSISRGNRRPTRLTIEAHWDVPVNRLEILSISQLDKISQIIEMKTGLQTKKT
ncbi:MAG TPA: hypothetical protein V6D23_26190 [Candidatus Obscuribacterales bacterium]